MGLFDKIFKPEEFKYTPSCEQEAWIAIMYAVMSVDGNASEAETNKMTEQVVYKKIFNEHPITEYFRRVLIAQPKIGSKLMIEISAPFISDEYKPTFFALVAEIVLADGVLDEKEKEILEFLVSNLTLDEELAQKIMEVTLIRTKGNYIIVD